MKPMMHYELEREYPELAAEVVRDCGYLEEGYYVVVDNEVYGPYATEEDIVEDWSDEEPWDGFNSDAEADADVLASAGWGTDEDYGYYGGEDY